MITSNFTFKRLREIVSVHALMVARIHASVPAISLTENFKTQLITWRCVPIRARQWSFKLEPQQQLIKFSVLTSATQCAAAIRTFVSTT